MAAIVACGDDTAVNSTDGATEAGPDVRTDSTPPPPVDAGDSSIVGDTGVDAPFDGGYEVDTFAGVLGVEMCKSLARCCYGNPTPGDGGADGGNFNVAVCVSFFTKVGFEASSLGDEVVDGGHVVVDQVNAAECIKDIQGLSCNLAGADFESARTACYGAYRGLQPAGAPCKDPIECQQSFFCSGAEDGGTGVCTALRPVNGPCGDFTADRNLGVTACSYRGGGDTGNFCKFSNIVGGGVTDLDPADWKCVGRLPIGAGCANGTWCSKALCDEDLQCITPAKYFDRACGQFVTP
jgi:hypothetical protein